MSDVVPRTYVRLVLAFALVPIMCVVAAPYILLRAFFAVDGYWRSVGSAFRKVIGGTLDFGTTFVQP